MPRPHRAFLEALRGAWRLRARPEQLPPAGAWTTWIFCGGRGSGKTRSGAEWVLERVAAGEGRVHLIAPTVADVRDVMLEGPAGILTIAPSHLRPIYQPTLRKLTWPNGAQALLFSGDEPDRLRGPQCGTSWIDELCAMRRAQEVLDNMYMGLRVGTDPKCLITTTPRPAKYFREILARDGQCDEHGRVVVVVTRSTSYDNRENLPDAFFAQVIAKYAGTRLGRQELEAEILSDVPGALWHLERIEELRVAHAPAQFERVVVAIDPAVTHGPDADETGIIVVGLASSGDAYVLDDLSGRYPPEEWARRAIHAYRATCADRIIAEVNQGGDLVEKTLRSVDESIPFRAVHASRGKLTRAEPVSALYEQGRVHHVGVLGPLEDQLTSYDGSRSGGSPDRLDALCWAVHELMLGEPAGGFIRTDSLLAVAPGSAARAPIEMPKRVDMVFAVAAGGIGAEPDALGTVYFGVSVYNDAPPVVILDWDLTAIEPGTFDAWLRGTIERLAILAGLASHGSGGLMVDPAAIGAVLIEHVLARGLEAQIPRNEKLRAMTLAERAVAVSAHVNSGRIQLTREAHEKVVAVKGVTRNHLLHQVAAFGLGQPQEGGVLLAALSLGALDAFGSPLMRRRVT